MATAAALIKTSLKKIGVIAHAETPSSAEQTDGLAELNRMIESWSNDGLLVFAETREEFTLTPSTASYTIGSGGDVSTDRPQRIHRALLQLQSTTPKQELPLKMCTLGEWSDILLKTLESSIPIYCYVEGSFPLETFHLWPVPSAAEKVVLYSWKPLATFSTAATSASFPPGYEDAIVYNLAERLCSDYGIPVPFKVEQLAVETLAKIKRMNEKGGILYCDPGILDPPPYNIHGGPFT